MISGWKRYALASLMTAAAGLAVRIYGREVVVGLFGRGWFSLMFFVPRLFLPALVALLVGYVLPKGFFLWGIAVLSLHPLAEAWQVYRADAGGAFGPSGISGSGLVGLALVTAMMLVASMVVCTIAAASGAGLRLLWWRLRGEPVGEKLGISPGNNGSAQGGSAP